jgi:hypothetical protein
MGSIITRQVIAPDRFLQHPLKQDSPFTEVYARRGGAVRHTTAVGPRGNVASRTVERGYAVAAGAAIGCVAAATADARILGRLPITAHV